MNLIARLLIAAAALHAMGCALDADGAGEVAQSTGGGGMTHRVDAEADAPSFGFEDASAGPAPIVFVTPGGASDKPDANAIDAAAPDAPVPPPPHEPETEDGGKKN